MKNDLNYDYIVKDILDNDEFKKLNTIEHHGTTRLDHSLKVSYYSYKVAKLLKLNYVSTARAGLLHDFFISEKGRDIKKKLVSTFTHPKKAKENANNIFNINEMEENIIASHMFPLYVELPKYAESWLVSLVDKMIGTKEMLSKLNRKCVGATNLLILILFNVIK